MQLPIAVFSALFVKGALAGQPAAPAAVEAPTVEVAVDDGDTGLDTPISAELIGQTARAVTEHREALRRCVSPEMTRDAPVGDALTGGLLVSFVVGVDGNVSNVKLQDTSLAQPEIETCIAEVFEELQFTEYDLEEPESVRFPLVVIY